MADDIAEETAQQLADSLAEVHQLLMADAERALQAGFSPQEWVRRIHLLLAYSLPPEHVEHTQRPDGSWQHRIRSGA